MAIPTSPEVAAYRRLQRKRSGKGQQREQAPVNYWRRKIPDHDFGDEEFRAVALRGGALTPLRLDDVLEQIEWTDAALMTGSIQVRQSQHRIRGRRGPRFRDEFNLAVGDVVQLASRRRGAHAGWTEVWRMRISKPTYALKDGTIAIELENDLAILARSRDDFKYKLDKDTKPKGWKPEEVTRDVCKRYGVRIGHLAATKVRIKNLTLENKSPLAVIQRAYRREKEESGRRFVIEIRGGRLYVRPLQRSKEMLILGDTLLDATLELSHQHGFATALDVTGTVKDGDKKRKKVNMGIVSRGSALRRFGYIVRPYKLEDEVSSEAAGRKRARIQLQELAKENRELTFTHPGVATLRRGHALRLQIDEGFVRKHVVFVREVTHTVSAGAYEMSVTVAFDDPFIDMDDAIAKEKWPKKAKERGRKSPRRASHDDAHPQPKKAAQRASSRRPHRRVS